MTGGRNVWSQNPPRKIGCEGSTHPVSNRLILDPNPINTFVVGEERAKEGVGLGNLEIYQERMESSEYDGDGRGGREGHRWWKPFWRVQHGGVKITILSGNVYLPWKAWEKDEWVYGMVLEMDKRFTIAFSCLLRLVEKFYRGKYICGCVCVWNVLGEVF